MTQKHLRIAFICCFGLFLTTIKAQVTIGVLEAPEKGMLLQLKEEGETKKGLMLPRVNLVKADSLIPMLKEVNEYRDGTKKDFYDKMHTGLTIYNLAYAGSLCPGLYTWGGSDWNRINSDKCIYLHVSPDKLRFKKSAPFPKKIAISSFPNNPHDLSHTGTIVWTTGGFPTNGQTKTEYEFQPDINNTNTELSSIVKLKVNHGGEELEKDIEVIQDPDDLVFEYTPNTAFPALGGSKTLSVTSEADWQVASLTGDNIVSNYPTTLQQIGTNQPFAFDLAVNNTWEAREAKLNVVSDNLDFVPQSIKISQETETVKLNITTASPIDFGQSPITKTVDLSTNAKWKFSPDTQYDNVIASSDLAANTQHEGGVPSNTVNKIVSFTSSANNDLPAGDYQTGVTFSTEDTAPQAAISQSVTLKRTVPSRFDYASISPASVGHAGGNITVTASSNDEWSVAASTGATASRAKANYASNGLVVNIPQNTLWSARNVTVNTNYNGASIQRTSFTQEGYTLNYGAFTPATNIPQAGRGQYIAFSSSTTAPVFTITAANASTVGTALSESAAGLTSATTENRYIGIQENPSWYNRTVSFSHTRPGTTDVALAVSLTQLGYTIGTSGISGNFPNNEIPPGGGSYSATLSTSTKSPYSQIRAVYSDGSTETYSVNDVLGTGDGNAASVVRSVTVNSNPQTYKRYVTFQYLAEHSTWTNIGNFIAQAAPPGYDMGNVWLYIDYGNGPQRTLALARSFCAGINPENTWRLPTLEEAKAFVAPPDFPLSSGTVDEIGWTSTYLFTSNGYPYYALWSISASGFSQGQGISGEKYQARCVRSK